MPQQAPIIAREGRLWLVLAVAATAVVAMQWPLLLPIPAGVTLLVYLLFRDPPRDIPSDPLAIVCPVDGWVSAVEPTDRGVLNGEATRIVISINSFGAYTARSPVEGKVLDLHEAIEVGPALHGSGGLWVRTDANEHIVLLLRRGPPGIRPAALIGYGERVGQGQRCAVIRLARCAELYVPINCRIETRRGAYVRAGTDVLATIIRK